MKQKIIILFLVFLLGCETNTTNYKPSSSGNIHTISVVIDNNLWEGPLGNEIRNVFSSEFEGLPQQEAMFSLVQIPPKIFTDFSREGRNIIHVSRSDKDTVFFEKNKYAAPQLILNLKGKSSKGIVENLKKISKQSISIFKKGEIAEKQKRIKKSILKTEEFQNLGFDLTLPSAYKLFKKDSLNKLWFQRETKKGSVNFLAYTLPFRSKKLDLKRIITIKDSIGKDFVPGRNEGSFLVTEKAYKPYFDNLTFKTFKTHKLRGTWEVLNDYMAGPFLMYYIEDIKNKRIIVLEGFVFSPSDRKREYMVEIEAIIQSLKVL